MSQTTTRAIETEAEPKKLFEFLSKVENIPTWAPVFADTIERIGDFRCRVVKNGETFELEVTTNKDAGTVDYIREMTGGKRGGAYIRVMPRPLGGSTVCMTVPIGVGVEADVAKVLEQELADLVRLAVRQ